MPPSTVAQIWRYPVKSLQGETVPAADIDGLGVPGDRQWGIVDLGTGLTLTARRAPELLHAWARLVDPDTVEVTLPDGTIATDDETLSAWLDRPVELRRARPDTVGTYEIATSIDDEHGADWVEWSGPEGTFHDSTRTRVSMIGLATIGDWARRRFRANLVLDVEEAGDEDDLVGRRVGIGGAVLEVTKRIDRCVITTRSQPEGIERDLDVLRTINAAHGSFLGVGSLVAAPGRVRVGDPLMVIPEPSTGRRVGVSGAA